MNEKIAKRVFTIGAISAVFWPIYAYYWKITTMDALSDGIRNDTVRMEKQGRGRHQIPQRSSSDMDDLEYEDLKRNHIAKENRERKQRLKQKRETADDSVYSEM